MSSITESLEIAIRCHSTGDLSEAEKHYHKVLRADDRHEGALFKLGNLYLAHGRWDESRECYETGLQINDEHVPAWNNLGNALDSLGDLEAAESAFRRALELRTDIPEVHNNLGTVIKKKGKIGDAIACYQAAIELNDQYAEAHNNLGIAQNDLGKSAEAIECFQRALKINPKFAEAKNNLGIALIALDQLEGAIEQFQQALEINSEYFEAYNNLGNANKELGQTEKSIECYSRALTLNPSYAEAHHNRARTLLLRGDYSQGWEEYEWRWKCNGLKPREFSTPEWDGSSLEGKTILVYAEQGVGDEIVFSSCLGEVVAQVDRCIVECDKRLIPLFQRSFPTFELFARPIDAALQSDQVPPIDFQVAMGSLPKFFRKSIEEFPRQQSFLIPDQGKVREWQNRFAELGHGLKVGISWRGGLRAGAVRKKSTRLDQWTSIFDVPGVHWINLQYGDCRDEIAEVEQLQGIKIHDWDDADPLEDLDNFAAEVAAVDLVISVSNTTVHTAGAVGVPVWTMLNFAPEWRWRLDDINTPWYSSMKLFRQPQRGDWAEVIEKVAMTLQVAVNKKQS